jgi:hypothetical protein
VCHIDTHLDSKTTVVATARTSSRTNERVIEYGASLSGIFKENASTMRSYNDTVNDMDAGVVCNTSITRTVEKRVASKV